jgi:putative salt-induced outer membrane protein YdiY
MPPRISIFRLFLLSAGLLLMRDSIYAQTETTQLGQRVVLQLANGDRVTGELIWRADGKLRFRSSILGDFTISETDAAILELAGETELNRGAKDVDGVSTKTAAEPTKKPPVASSVAPETASKKNVQPAPRTAPETAKIPPLKPWKGKLEFGYAQQSGLKDTLSYNLRGEAEKQIDQHTLKTTGRILYSEQNQRPSADRTDSNFRWRYQISKRTFSQAQTTYLRDDITQIHANFEQNVGLGYRIIDLKRHALNIGAGVTGQYRDWDAGTNGFAPYGEVFEDYTFKINDRIMLVQDVVVQYSPEDRAFNIPANGRPAPVNPDLQNYKVRFNSTLQGKVTERISVNLRFEYELDNAIQLQGARKNQRITSSIGYAF